MAVDGTYNIEMNTPMGNRTATLVLKTDGNALSGTLTEETGENTLEGGTVTGDEFSFTVQVSTVMGKIELTVTGSVSEDSISGQAQAGQFGSFAYQGTRL